MKSKLISDGPQRTYAVVFATGDEVIEGLTQFAKDNGLAASQFTAIGAFSAAVLGYFDWSAKDYLRIPVREQVEVVSLVGDVATKDGKPHLHAHVVVSRRDGHALGGHLLEAHVRPTLEVVLTESPAHLRREHDAETGLALIRL
jgi:predicted DNA-binding protein with PD1-like motif